MFMNHFRISAKKAVTSSAFRFAKRNFNSEKPFSKENIPFYGAIVGVTALTFQVLVLFPWHEELSVQFAAIQTAIQHMEDFSKSLDDKMDKVMALEEQVKLKERYILKREEEILAMEMKVVERLEHLTEVIKGQASTSTSERKQE